MKKVLALLTAMTLLLGGLGLNAIFAEEASLTTDKTAYGEDEPIMVTAVSTGAKDWVGIYYQGDPHSIRWDYVTTVGSGVAFDIRNTTEVNDGAPEKLAPGKYVIRLMPDDSTDVNRALAEVEITIGNPPTAGGDLTKLIVPKTTYAYNEPILVKAEGSGKDWLGIYYVNNDRSIRWNYVSEIGSGTEVDVRTLLDNGSAPDILPAGDYVIRLMPNDSSDLAQTVAWVQITIEETVIDEPITETAVGYIQTREHKADPQGKFDARIIIEANQNYIQNFSSATLDMVFTLANGSTRAFSNSNTTVYREVQSGGEVYTATKDCALFGVAVVGVPMGTRSVSVKVTFRDVNSGEETVLNIGTTSLAITSPSTISDVKSMNRYDYNNITVTETDDGQLIDGNEGACKLFDGTTKKHGSHKTKFSVSFTTKEAITISGIIFTIAGDTYSYGTSRTYHAWTLYGWDEKTEKWLEVAFSTQPITTGTSKVADGVDPDTVDDSNRQAYVVNNAGEYSSYRLEVVGGGGYTQMGEITLYTAKSN